MPDFFANPAPFLTWAGGKRRVIPSIVKVIPDKFNAYYEPFLGGGALFFALQKYLNKTFLSDFNDDLISTYIAIQQDVSAVVECLKYYNSNHSSNLFYKVRDDFQTYTDKVSKAAAFIYLNKSCFSGIYRVNRNGKFNVPMKRQSNINICDERNLREVFSSLKSVDIKTCSFEKINPQLGDFVYCDPPYDGTFTDYTKSGFDRDKQVVLKDCADIWSSRGAHVVVSNSDTGFIRDLWRDWDFRDVSVASTINRTNKNRENAMEVLITHRA